MFEKLKNQQGFTMIEMIVSMAIIVIMVSVFLANYHGTNKRTELILSTQKMVSDIRMAQNNTLGSVEYNSQIPDGGWGVHLDLASDSRKYFIFADLNANLKYDAGEAETSMGGRQINLARAVEMFTTSIGNNVDITFLPPDPVTNIFDGLATSTDVYITLREETGSFKRVYVNFFGLIEAVD